MLRGIVTGLGWGSLVGFGLITIANEFVAPVDITLKGPETETAAPASLAPESGEATAPEVTPEMPAAEPDRAGAQPDVSTPDSDTDAAPQTDAMAAPKPDVAAPDTLAPVDDTPATAPQAAPDSPVLAPPQTLEPQAPGAEAMPAIDMAPPAAPVPVAPEVAEGVMAPEAPSEEPAEAAEPAVAEENTPETAMAPPLETPAEGDSLPQDPEPASRFDSAAKPLGQKVTAFTEREDNRISSRLPTVAGNSAEAPVVEAADLPALVANAATFEATVTGPMLSVVLVDIGAIGPDDPAIAALPFPVSFGIDAQATGATGRAEGYRARDFEVLAMVEVPEGSSPQEAAINLNAARDTVPVAVGFLDVPAASFQASRQIAAQVVATATETGHAVVTFPRGLDALEQEAQRAEAPAALVFRDFDGRGQDGAAMKRFLDQAAFRAGIDGKIVLVGRSKPDTLAALAEWALSTRAASVTLVPLSVLLTSAAP